MTDEEFLAIVREEMAEYADLNVMDRGDQFAVWFIEKILAEQRDDAVELFHIGGSGDNKIDIGVIDPQSRDVVVIGQCKFSDNPLATTFGIDLPEDVLNAVERIQSMPSAGSSRRREFVKRYNEKPSDISTRLLAVGFGSFSSDAIDYAVKHDVELFDYKKIKQRYLYNEVIELPSEPEILKLETPERTSPRKIERYRARQWIFLGLARDIFRAVDEYKDGLFVENLRYRLPASTKSPISANIQETILTDPGALAIFNNGLTVVAKRVVEEKNHLILHSPQIVNGCQTSWAIYDAFKTLEGLGKDPATIETELLIKLIETSDESLVGEITERTNNQNPISPRDLKAKDEVQAEIAGEFELMRPRISYSFKAGQWEQLAREQRRSRYAVSGARYRRLENMQAAQLYLAVLGLPWASKQNKGKIFSEASYYRVVFGVNVPPSDRFAAEDIFQDIVMPLDPSATGFCRDVLFAFEISQLADSLKRIYSKKLRMYVEPIKKDESLARDNLHDDFEFYKFWHYLLVAAVNYVILKWADFGNYGVETLRTRLVGTNVDLFFGPPSRLDSKFNPDLEKRFALILDQENPSADFFLFSIWAKAIADKVAELARDYRSGQVRFKWQSFIDQRSETFKDLKRWIDLIFSRGTISAAQIFPVQVSDADSMLKHGANPGTKAAPARSKKGSKNVTAAKALKRKPVGKTLRRRK